LLRYFQHEKGMNQILTLLRKPSSEPTSQYFYPVLVQSMKSFLVSVGVAQTGRYLSKLHTNNEIWDEDLERKSDLENRVREALEERLTGTEGFEGAERIAREVVDHELE
jgi:hypothetical protein